MSFVSLFADLPEAKAPIAGPKPLDVRCCLCGSLDWTRVKVGTASTAELYRSSNVVALRDDDGDPTVAWCLACDPLIVRGRPEPVSPGDQEFMSWSATEVFDV